MRNTLPFPAAVVAVAPTLAAARAHAHDMGIAARIAEIAVAATGMIPVSFTITTWATRRDLTHEARGGETSLATVLRPT